MRTLKLQVPRYLPDDPGYQNSHHEAYALMATDWRRRHHVDQFRLSSTVFMVADNQSMKNILQSLFSPDARMDSYKKILFKSSQDEISGEKRNCVLVRSFSKRCFLE